AIPDLASVPTRRSSDLGTLLYRSGGDENKLMTVQWLDGTGKTQPLLSKPAEYVHTALSPDGQRLAMAVAEGPNLDIWVYDRQGRSEEHTSELQSRVDLV